MAIGVVIEPLLAWLWAGGLLVGLGGLLALVPGSRRRATDPVSAPSDLANGTSAPSDDRTMNGVPAPSAVLEPTQRDSPAEQTVSAGEPVPVESGAPST